MSTDKTYNGWSNYETWAVNLWMDNDEGSQTYWTERATEAYENAEADDTFTKAERAALNLMDEIKEQHEEAQEEFTRGKPTGIFNDLLNAAMSEVNWHEIAMHYIDAVVEEQAAKE